ncbi:MAG: serine hydrolase domain-containing protein, partial [Pseudomonadota bacterium]
YQLEAGDSRSDWDSKQTQDVVVQNDPIKIAAPITGRKATGRLEDWVPSYMKTYGLRTAGIAVIENSEISYLKTFGKEADGDPANDDTRFRVASITKPITTMTLMRLIEMGLWDLDTPLSRYWVDPDLEEDPRHEALTTRLAFRHLTGLPNWRRRPGLSFLYEPGTIQSYSGEGFQYARRAVEAATGKTLEDLARTNVFDPAGMTDTSYQWSDAKAHRFAGEYFGSGAQVNHYKGDGINAAANLLSTPRDLARFAQWMVAEYDRQPDWWAEMTTPNGYAVIDPTSQAPERFGLGWSVHKRDGVTVIEHSGGQNGIRTHLIIIPEQKKALVVLTNSSAGWPFIRSVFDATLNRNGELAETGNALYGDVKF